jgi:predicted HicB family RNase H-like nuclease
LTMTVGGYNAKVEDDPGFDRFRVEVLDLAV